MFSQILRKSSNLNFNFGTVKKCVDLVDPEKLELQNENIEYSSTSIQPRTSPSKYVTRAVQLHLLDSTGTVGGVHSCHGRHWPAPHPGHGLGHGRRRPAFAGCCPAGDAVDSTPGVNECQSLECTNRQISSSCE